MDLATLEQQALELSAEERAVLAQHLLASLDQDEGIEEAWAAEVERCVAEVESGAVQLIPLAEALAQVRARRSAIQASAFVDLAASEEDIYSLEDGVPFNNPE